ncbi:alpha/beta hydrolase [Intrasporangium sp. YIM S08009]|uniref:alpha/beta hydrolase n=1 Tax=Intrasporangium zincisolvens TaxID=3080018 RepID=UPI002B0564A4|nr:alpha/beta hydrolase [Intrasporangium sp. YIM S08009]
MTARAPGSADAHGARLIDTRVPRDPQGIALLLHGGGSRPGAMRVSPAQLSVLRLVPTASRIARSAPRVAVHRLLNSYRGWDTRHTPVQDVAWALDALRARHGSVPVCLVGHSLGGRAAILSLGHRDVRSVVALAPWVHTTDAPGGDLADTSLLVVHGDDDRVASPERAFRVARALAPRMPVGYIAVRGGRHSMLRRHEVFDGLAAAFVADTLGPGRSPDPLRPVGGGYAGVVARALAGEAFIEV